MKFNNGGQPAEFNMGGCVGGLACEDLHLILGSLRSVWVVVVD